MNCNRDFTGMTTAEAANQLWRFVKKNAEQSSVALEYEVDDTHSPINELVARATGASCSCFQIEISFEIERFVAIQRRMNPQRLVFGWGSITKREAQLLLELRRDPDGLFRWYAVPKVITESVKTVAPSLCPFVLTEEYVADGFRALVAEKG